MKDAIMSVYGNAHNPILKGEIKMKKLLLLAFALILVVALCACDGGEGDTTSDTTAASTESTTTKSENKDTDDESEATDTESATESDSETVVGESDTESDTESNTEDESDTDVTTDNGGEDVTEDETGDSLSDRFDWEYSDVELLYIGDDVTKDADKGTTYGTTPVELAPGKSIATKFTVTKGALATVCISCPSWNDWDAGDLNTGSVKLSLYYWVDGAGKAEKDILKDGYTKTLATDPIATITSTDHPDNGVIELYADTLELPEGGTFLVVLTNIDEEENLRIGYQESSFNCRDYYSREELTFKLPTDDAIKEAGYDPQYSTDVVGFNQSGAPAYKSFANFYFDVQFPPEA